MFIVYVSMLLQYKQVTKTSNAIHIYIALYFYFECFSN